MKRLALVTVLLAICPVLAVAAPAADARHRAEPARSNHHHRRADVSLPRMHDRATQARKARVPARLKRRPVHPVSSVRQAEREGFKKVSSLVNFPAFYPGLGIVYVKPDTLPVGPFRCFDRKGKLVASVYMLPLKDLDDHKRWDYVKGLPAPADHATFYFHPGHPGVPMPHYHFVIWHVPRSQEALVAR